MKWIKASETAPIKPGVYCCRSLSNQNKYYYCGLMLWSESEEDRQLFKDQYKYFEWLDETEQPQPDETLDIETIAKKLLSEIHKHTTLCINEQEEHIFTVGVNSSAAYIKEKMWSDDQVADMLHSYWEDATCGNPAIFDQKEWLNQYKKIKNK